MIERFVNVETAGGQYSVQMLFAPGSPLIHVSVEEVRSGKLDRVVIRGVVQWGSFSNLKFYGGAKARHLGPILKAIEEELGCLSTSNPFGDVNYSDILN